METGCPIPEDARDIAAALSGDGEGYRRLVIRYQGEIGKQMRRFSRDALVLDELVHDVFVEAYQSLQSYKGSAPWLHWLRKIAIRVGYCHWTSRKGKDREITLPEKTWQRLRGSDPILGESFEAAEVVNALLARLSPSDRLILTLLYVDGLTMAEAAGWSGWTVGGAKVRAFRARYRLRKLIEKGAP